MSKSKIEKVVPLMGTKSKIIIICGHYGCGKTNFALNLAIDKAKQGEKVTLIDLDLVNPYFVSAEYRSILEGSDVKVIASPFAGTNIDTPTLPPESFLMFNTEGTIIMDVGGDDAGAVILGRFRQYLSETDYEMYYLVNKYRSLTTTAEEAAVIAGEIEAASRCRITGIVNNSHLKTETTAELVADSVEYAKEVARLTGHPLLYVTVPESLEEELRSNHAEIDKNTFKLYPVRTLVKAVWE